MEVPAPACCDVMHYDGVHSGLVHLLLVKVDHILNVRQTELSKFQGHVLSHNGPNTKYFEIRDITLTYRHWGHGAKFKNGA